MHNTANFEVPYCLGHAATEQVKTVSMIHHLLLSLKWHDKVHGY